jgi:hypothetical protein
VPCRALFGRRSSCLQNAPSCLPKSRRLASTRIRCCALGKRPIAAPRDWRLLVSEPRAHAHQAVRAMPATDFYTCRLTSLPSQGAGRSTIICIRPLAIRRSLVPGRPFCHAAASRPTRLCFGRPDQSSTRRCRRFPCFASLSSSCCVLHLFAWGSGVGSAGVQPARNTQADGAPKVPGAGGRCPRRRLSRPTRPAPRYAAGFRALELVSFDRQSTSLAPAGTSPRSR